MALTVNDVVTLFNTYIGDASTNRISAAERLQYVSEGTTWLMEELGNEHMVNTYELEYLDGIHRYKVTAGLADLLVGADLRRQPPYHTVSFSRKSPREMAEEVNQGTFDPAWAIERTDKNIYLVVNFDPIHQKQSIDACDSVGTWVVDATGSDATNLTIDENEFKQGTASLNFDVDVSQSGNNKSTIYNPSVSSLDLSSLEDLGSWTFWAYVPENLYTSSITLSWSSDVSKTPSTKSNYWSATITTDIDGASLADGWNQIRVDWADATTTGTPDSGAIVYLQIDINYTGSQVDDTDYRIDDLAICQPERVTFHYVTFFLGTDTTGVTDRLSFTATSDIPFFSGQYDSYKYSVAHKAASLAFYTPLRLRNEGQIEENEAVKSLDRYRKLFESQKTRELKSFKVRGVNLRNRRVRRTIS